MKRSIGRRGQFAEAIAHFRKALELEPDLALAHYNLGLALAGCEERSTRPSPISRRLWDIKPDYAEAHNNPGLALTPRTH